MLSIILQDDLKSETSKWSPHGTEDDYVPGQSSDSEDEYDFLDTSTKKRKLARSKTEKHRGRGYAAYRHSLMQRSGLPHSQTQASTSTAVRSGNYRVKRRIGRPRGSRGVARAELLSQHEAIANELLEEDIARGLELNSPRKKSNKGRNLPLNEGIFTNKY